MLEVDGPHVLAYRAAAQGLHRSVRSAAEVPVLELGIRDSNVSSGRLGLAARLTEVPADLRGLDMVWSYRGAPHLHRHKDVTTLATRLWPGEDADATARLNEAPMLRKAGIGAVEAFREASAAMYRIVTKPMTRGEVSGAITKALPRAYSYECRGCQCVHIYGGIFQQIGVFAGTRLVPGSTPATLEPVPGRTGVPEGPGKLAELVRIYLRFNGPANETAVATYFGTSRTVVKQHWPDGLAEVKVHGKSAWLPEENLAELRKAPEPPRVRLLPAFDPILEGRDRDVLVPDKARQKTVWAILGNPGVVLADGEITGLWRAKLGGKKRLDVTVEAFDGFPPDIAAEIRTEAETVAAARGVGEVRVIGC